MVQVPVPALQKIQSGPALPKNDRINLQVESGANNILKKSEVIGGFVEGVDKIYTEVEDSKIDTLSNDFDNKYSIWKEEKLNKIKSIEGDPTDAYAQFDIDENEYRKELLSNLDGASSRVKSHVTSRLDKTMDNQRVGVLKQRGLQQESYDNKVFESSVKLKRTSMPVTAGYIRKDDAESFTPFEQNIDDIKTLVAKRGLKNGTVTVLDPDSDKFSHQYTDGDGNIVKVNMTPIAKQRLAQELNQGVVSSIDVLLSSGYDEEARILQDRYKGFIDPKSAATLANKFKSNDVTNKAHDIAGTIEGLGYEAQKAALSKIEDHKVKTEVLNIINTNAVKMEAMRDRQHQINYEAMYDLVEKKAKSGNPFHTVYELEQSEEYKKLGGKTSPAKREALKKMIEAPDEDDPVALSKVQDVLLGVDPNISIQDLTPGQFNEYLAGLSKTTRGKMQTQYMSLKLDTNAEKRATYRRGEQFLKEQMLRSKIIKKDKFGKLSGKNELIYIEAKTAFIDKLAAYGTNIDDKQLQEFIKGYATSIVEERPYNPVRTKQTFNEPKTKEKTLTPEEEKAAQEKDLALIKKFKKEKGFFPKTNDPVYLDWKKNQ